jgi:hypothetical protein
MATIEIDDAVASALEAEARARHMTLSGYLQTLAERVKPDEPAKSPDRLSYEEWLKLFEDWLASHKRLDYIADDSRESIYEGRGE